MDGRTAAPSRGGPCPAATLTRGRYQVSHSRRSLRRGKCRERVRAGVRSGRVLVARRSRTKRPETSQAYAITRKSSRSGAFPGARSSSQMSSSARPMRLQSSVSSGVMFARTMPQPHAPRRSG